MERDKNSLLEKKGSDKGKLTMKLTSRSKRQNSSINHRIVQTHIIIVVCGISVKIRKETCFEF